MAHSNTIFHQLLQLLDKHDFRRIEQNGFKPKRKYRTLSRWGQFVVMMFAQITGRSSLRDIVHQFQFQSGKLYPLGLKVVKRSTLADANNKRRLIVISLVLLVGGVLVINFIVVNQNYSILDEAYLRTKTYPCNILNNMADALVAIDRKRKVQLHNEFVWRTTK